MNKPETESAFYLPNVRSGRCVVRLRNGLPCRFKAKYACHTCDVHEKHEEAATAAVAALKSRIHEIAKKTGVKPLI